MGTMKSLAKKTRNESVLPSGDESSTLNRAGGLAFDITDPAIKLVTMTGGSFFGEPRYYSADVCVPQRDANGRLGKLQERIKLAKKTALEGSKAIKVVNCAELDEVSLEVMATAWDVLNSDQPSDLLKIAHWLRRSVNIRLTPQVLLVLASRHPKGQEFVREYAPKVIARPDEIKTCILMHRFFFGMKNLKSCLSKGLSDAMSSINERGLIKYEGQDYPAWKDVLCIVDRKAGYPLSKPLHRYFCFGEIDEVGTPIAHARQKLSKCKTLGPRAKGLVADSYANWEVVLSQFGQTPDQKRAVWEYLIKKDLVGYMALLRNIRNMLNAGVSDATVEAVCAKLSDREEVLRSKQLPFRFAMAYSILDTSHGSSGYGSPYGYDYDNGNAATSATWNEIHRNMLVEAVNSAADLASENVPSIPGLTAIFADNSGSMNRPVSENSKVSCALAANILCGIAAKRSEKAVVCAFGTDVAPVAFSKQTAIMDFVHKVAKANTKGCSTNTHRCVQWLDAKKIKPDRVIILSDMQCWDSNEYSDQGASFGNVWSRFKKGHKNCWLHSVNLNGYGDSMTEPDADKVNLVGSFSEKVFNMLLMAEGSLGEDALPTIEQIRAQW